MNDDYWLLLEKHYFATRALVSVPLHVSEPITYGGRINGTNKRFCQEVKNITFYIIQLFFKQTIGILMMNDCAPVLANLYLFYYE